METNKKLKKNREIPFIIANAMKNTEVINKIKKM